MKKLILIFIIVLPLISYADTLDYWSVYLNDSLIGQYNSMSNDNEIEIVLREQTIDQNDTISIVYGNDHPCIKCEYYYAVKDKNEGVKIYVERRNEILQKVFFPLSKLKGFNRSKEFEFFVFENSYINDKDIYTVLFKLKIE